jgi:hypothetical protein
VRELILDTLEMNGSLCMDNEEERERLADALCARMQMRVDMGDLMETKYKNTAHELSIARQMMRRMREAGDVVAEYYTSQAAMPDPSGGAAVLEWKSVSKFVED